MLWLLCFQKGREGAAAPSQGSLQVGGGGGWNPALLWAPQEGTSVPSSATASAVGQGGFGPPELSHELLHSSVCL